MIRQIDIARKLGVSLAVVSRALSPHKGKNDNLSDETREKIREAAAGMGYRKNLAAMSLRKGCFHRIAFIVQNYDSYMEMIRPMEDLCKQNGYELILMHLSENEEEIRRTFEHLLQGGFDAVITFLYTWSSVANSLTEFLAQKHPVVLVGTPVDVVAVPGMLPIHIDLGKPVRECTRMLYELGHRKIVCTMAMKYQNEKPVNLFTKYYPLSSTLKELGVTDWDPVFYFTPTKSRDKILDGYNAAEALLQQKPQATACLCYNDFFAIGLMRGLQEKGIRVPEDFSVIGSDNNSIGRFSQTALTTLDLCGYDGAMTSLNFVFEQLRNPDFENIPEPVYLKGHLVVRESTGPVSKTAKCPLKIKHGEDGKK